MVAFSRALVGKLGLKTIANLVNLIFTVSPFWPYDRLSWVKFYISKYVIFDNSCHNFPLRNPVFVIDLSQLTFIFASSHISNTFCEFLKVSLKRSLYKYVKKFDLKRIKENIQNGGQL